ASPSTSRCSASRVRLSSSGQYLTKVKDATSATREKVRTDEGARPMNAPMQADTAPRYTSYPTAPHFHPGIDAAVVEGWLAAIPQDERLSLYIHVPFCDRLCWF